jgi:hypothetical protein
MRGPDHPLVHAISKRFGKECSALAPGDGYVPLEDGPDARGGGGGYEAADGGGGGAPDGYGVGADGVIFKKKEPRQGRAPSHFPPTLDYVMLATVMLENVMLTLSQPTFHDDVLVTSCGIPSTRYRDVMSGHVRSGNV